MKLQYWSPSYELWERSSGTRGGIETCVYPLWTEYRLLNDAGDVVTLWPKGYVGVTEQTKISPDVKSHAADEAAHDTIPKADYDRLRADFDRLCREAWEVRRESLAKERELEGLRGKDIANESLKAQIVGLAAAVAKRDDVIRNLRELNDNQAAQLRKFYECGSTNPETLQRQINQSRVELASAAQEIAKLNCLVESLTNQRDRIRTAVMKLQGL